MRRADPDIRSNGKIDLSNIPYDISPEELKKIVLYDVFYKE